MGRARIFGKEGKRDVASTKWQDASYVSDSLSRLPSYSTTSPDPFRITRASPFSLVSRGKRRAGSRYTHVASLRVSAIGHFRSHRAYHYRDLHHLVLVHSLSRFSSIYKRMESHYRSTNYQRRIYFAGKVRWNGLSNVTDPQLRSILYRRFHFLQIVSIRDFLFLVFYFSFFIFSL